MASTSEVGAQPISFSQTGSLTLKQYRRDMGFVVREHRKIEGAKGEWLLLYNDYKAGDFPKTNEGLKSKMAKETDAYLGYQSATEKAKALLDRFNAAISYSSRSKISKDTYVTLQRAGYKVDWAKQEEVLLGQVVPKLRALRDRVNNVWSHMNERLPKAGANLGAAFYHAYGKLGQAGFGSSISSSLSWLDKAIAARKAELGADKIVEEDDKDDFIDAASGMHKELTPEQENLALATLSEDLETVLDEDPFTQVDDTTPRRRSSGGTGGGDKEVDELSGAGSARRKGARVADEEDTELKEADPKRRGSRVADADAEEEEEDLHVDTSGAGADKALTKPGADSDSSNPIAEAVTKARSRASSDAVDPEAGAPGSKKASPRASSDAVDPEAGAPGSKKASPRAADSVEEPEAGPSGSKEKSRSRASSDAPGAEEETDGKDASRAADTRTDSETPAPQSFADVVSSGSRQEPLKPTRPPLPKGPPPATDATGGAAKGGKKRRGGGADAVE